MNNFTYYAPTRVIFGRDTECETGNAVKEAGRHGGGGKIRFLQNPPRGRFVLMEKGGGRQKKKKKKFLSKSFL